LGRDDLVTDAGTVQKLCNVRKNAGKNTEEYRFTSTRIGRT